jgi:hypothetical protein
VAGPTDSDQFLRAVEALLDLRASGALRILVGAAWQINFVQFEVVRDHASVDQILSARTLTPEDLEEPAEYIGELLSSALRNEDLEDLLASREATEPQARERAQLVLDRFQDDLHDLAPRFWIKATSKVQVPDRFEWEVASKLADDELAPPRKNPVAFATLRVLTESPEFSYYSGMQQRAVALTVDIEDLDFLIDSMKRCREALAAAEAGSLKQGEDGV